MTLIILGILAGAAASAPLFILSMRRYMITAQKVEASFERVCSSLEKAVAAPPGWGRPLPEWDFHAAKGEKGNNENKN